MPQRASRRAVEPSREQELTTGLWLRPDENRSSILVERPQGLVPLAAVVFEEHRALSMLAMLGGRRLLDVTVQPGALARVVSSEAVAARRDGNAWCSAIEAAVARVASERGLWRRTDAAPRGLVPLLTGLGYPMVASVYDRGGRAVAEVPRWAAHVLAQPSARAAAAAAFGSRATRPATRALATSLVPSAGAPADATIALGPLCLALMGRAVLEPDQLVRVLAAGDIWHAPPVWLAASRLESAALVITGLGPVAATRLLLDAATRPRGIEVLLDTLDLYRCLRHQFSAVPPGQLDALRGACLELAPTPTETVAAADAEHRRRAEARRHSALRLAEHVRAPEDPEPTPDDHDGSAAARSIFVPRTAPAVRATCLPASYDHPAALRELHHLTAGDVRLLLPRTPAVLTTWGQRLSNCLGSYARAVAAGTVWVVGIEEHGVLTACAAIDPGSREVRQLLAAHNRPPSASLVETTLHLLASRRVICAGAPV